MTYDLIFLEPDSPDPTLLFLHVFSVFHEEIQSFGQENRMRLLDTLKSVLYDYIPAFYPQYYFNYPNTLDEIYDLVEETINISRKKQKASA